MTAIWDFYLYFVCLEKETSIIGALMPKDHSRKLWKRLGCHANTPQDKCLRAVQQWEPNMSKAINETTLQGSSATQTEHERLDPTLRNTTDNGNVKSSTNSTSSLPIKELKTISCTEVRLIISGEPWTWNSRARLPELPPWLILSGEGTHGVAFWLHVQEQDKENE
jgi:hypothetical protein